MAKKQLLRIQDLSVSFTQYDAGTHQVEVPVIEKLHVDVDANEVVAIVGASGSGKTLLAEAIIGRYARNAHVRGVIEFRGAPADAAQLARLRGREIALVPQSVTSLDPLMRVGEQIVGAPIGQKRGKWTGRERTQMVARMQELLARYELPQQVARMYPFELSGGMARRAILAAALMTSPNLIVADEPTPGMHPELAAQAMDDLRDYANQGNGVLLITHDIELALTVADRIAVFYAGTVVELAHRSDFDDPSRLRHPYTRALWRALPGNGFEPLAGSQPIGRDKPPGCPFGPRCDYFIEACLGDVPPIEVRNGMVRCVNPQAYTQGAR